MNAHRAAAADVSPPVRFVGVRRPQSDVRRQRRRTRRGLLDRFLRRIRRVATQASSIMQYLGRIAGSGVLSRDGEMVARASYEFEGFLRPRGIVVSSGEISLAPTDLKAVFGRPGVQLRTDDGRLLQLRFSEKELRLANGVAEVEVSGDLPGSPTEWRGRSHRLQLNV